MPKSKEFIESDSDSGSDSSVDKPKAKKKKVEKPSKKEKEPEGKSDKQKRDKEGNVMFQLSKMRFVTANQFRGKKMVNIREFYEADGELRPGKKGIALTEDQWKSLKEAVDGIDEALDEL